MNLEIQILKRRRTWSGWFVLTGLLTLLRLPSRLWGRFWPTRTRLGGPHRQLGELPKRLFQFQKAWTISNPAVQYKFKRVEIRNGVHFGVLKPYYPPPLFFKSNITNEVFVTLNQSIMRWAINLDNCARIQQDEVYYDPRAKEWVLGSVSFPEVTYKFFEPDLRWSAIRIQPGPITKEHTYFVGGTS